MHAYFLKDYASIHTGCELFCLANQSADTVKDIIYYIKHN